MYKFVLVFSLFLTACSTSDSSKLEMRAQALLAWRNSMHTQALNGTIPWSTYYVDYYDKLKSMPVDRHALVEMQAIAELIPYARKYEAGEITKDQFYDTRRLIGTKADASQRELIDREIAAQNAEEAQAEAMQRARNSSTKPLQTLNCTTTRVPGSNTSNTTCR